MERDIAAGNAAVKRKTETDFRWDAFVDKSGNIFASMSSVATARMRTSPQMLDPSVNRAQKGAVAVRSRRNRIATVNGGNTSCTSSRFHTGMGRFALPFSA